MNSRRMVVAADGWGRWRRFGWILAVVGVALASVVAGLAIVAF